jgi:CRISPR/Cas system-associated endoribonuclease Cas2
MVLNRGEEFKGKVINLLNKWGVNKIQISIYHTPVNRIIKRGHKPLKDALSKLSDNWVINLVIVLFVD